MIPFLVEDPEFSETLKALQESKLIRSQQRWSDSLLQFQQSPVIHPSKEGEKATSEQSLFFKGKTAIEVDEERLSFFRHEDIPLVSQVHVDDSPFMNISKDSF